MGPLTDLWLLSVSPETEEGRQPPWASVVEGLGIEGKVLRCSAVQNDRGERTGFEGKVAQRIITIRRWFRCPKLKKKKKKSEERCKGNVSNII